MTEAATAFTACLHDLERRTAELENDYEEMFKSIGFHLFDYALDNDSASATMPHLYTYTDDTIAALLQSRFNTQPLDCKLGCAHCCYLTVTCPPQVIFYVADYLRAHWAEADISDLLGRLDTYVSDKAKSTGKNPACPFLNDANACKIYEARPISCRAFTSANVQTCHKFIEERDMDVSGVPQHTLIYRVYEMATTALQGSAQKHNRDKEQVLFIPALATALRAPDLETRWQAGEPFPT